MQCIDGSSILLQRYVTTGNDAKNPAFLAFVCYGEQGWCSGESARLPPMCPGFDSRTRRHMWAEFVGSLLCSERFFSGNSGFPLSSKTNI